MSISPTFVEQLFIENLKKQLYCSFLHYKSFWRKFVKKTVRKMLVKLTLQGRRKRHTFHYLLISLSVYDLVSSICIQTPSYVPGVSGIVTLKEKKYWTPEFLGFFGFVKTIKLLITQKKLRHKHKITASMMPQIKIVCFINSTEKYVIFKFATAY